MLSVILALALATPTPTATPTPAPSLTPPPGWTATTAAEGELANFTRREPDGTSSTIILRAQVCECEPTHMLDMLQATLGRVTGVTISRTSGTACNQPAQSALVTGLAQSGPGRKNFYVSAFRSEDSLYTQQYVFDAPKPTPDAIATVQTLCPQPSQP